jgi:mannan endo-1,4-beta-mannosidase
MGTDPAGIGAHPRLGQIIDGTFDGYLDSWAVAARNDGRPIVLRFAAEMNGNWYPWSESLNGNAVGEFAQAWRHIHDRFEAVGADNVIWLWSVNRTNNLSTDIATYYPGDEYVDWVGMSGYLRQLTPGVTPSFSATFDLTLGQLRALTTKPILLAEIGAGTDETNKSAWIRSLFSGMAASPDIIGFLYFNDQKVGGDWRLQTSQAVVNAFADGVDHPRWRTGVNPGGMVPGQRVTLPASGVS